VADIVFHSMEEGAYLWTVMHVADEKGVSYDLAPVSAQIVTDDDGEAIAMFELDFDGDEVIRVREAHYRLVPHKISRAELEKYYARRDQE